MIDIGEGGWKQGVPPAPGWYNASTAECTDMARYWDGDAGSEFVVPSLSAVRPASATFDVIRDAESIGVRIHFWTTEGSNAPKPFEALSRAGIMLGAHLERELPGTSWRVECFGIWHQKLVEQGLVCCLLARCQFTGLEPLALALPRIICEWIQGDACQAVLQLISGTGSV